LLFGYLQLLRLFFFLGVVTFVYAQTLFYAHRICEMLLKIPYCFKVCSTYFISARVHITQLLCKETGRFGVASRPGSSLLA
jgi:hypothetical protein